ncbi:uncharacterized protein HD556DRAFT_1304768 [Suillus plorans]|uniref:Uncharacterized protein n=1 Tax=Suillus plorans TaxID=116603 RepID=A0A9P7J302_9AGAM|nr:uncharacterized protein HD556DRAFT_1304768 [Suillus plorans]KAG1800753.1 hypothetical protein HD556DRAFT_1304768 [Suillus plorans]
MQLARPTVHRVLKPAAYTTSLIAEVFLYCYYNGMEASSEDDAKRQQLLMSESGWTLKRLYDNDVSELADYAAGIARSSITDRTRDGHARLILCSTSSETPNEAQPLSHAKHLMTSVPSLPTNVVRKTRDTRAKGAVTKILASDSTHTLEERRWGVVRYTAYLFAWLMLLRIEEVVTLEFTSVEIIPGERAYIEIWLKTQKSAQTGVLHVWRLWANDADARLCPVQALVHLASLYGAHSPLKGPLLLRIGKLGDVLHDQPALYGTHSFRRGGCQHHIRNYGFDVEALTMFQYFYSPNDNHKHMVEYDQNDKKRVKF